MLMKKMSWSKVGKFKEDKKGRYVVEDLDFIQKVEKQGLTYTYSNEAIVNWSIPSKYKDIFLRFSSYSTGTLHASMYRIWHFGLSRNCQIGRVPHASRATVSNWQINCTGSQLQKS